jgi:hypothetical protein
MEISQLVQTLRELNENSGTKKKYFKGFCFSRATKQNKSIIIGVSNLEAVF